MRRDFTQTNKQTNKHTHTHVEIGQKQTTLCVKTHTRMHFGAHPQPKQAHHSFHAKAKRGSRHGFLGCAGRRRASFLVFSALKQHDCEAYIVR
jgi:hypothetical protein